MSFVELNCSLCKFDLHQSKHSTGQKTDEIAVERGAGTTDSRDLWRKGSAVPPLRASHYREQIVINTWACVWVQLPPCFLPFDNENPIKVPFVWWPLVLGQWQIAGPHKYTEHSPGAIIRLKSVICLVTAGFCNDYPPVGSEYVSRMMTSHSGWLTVTRSTVVP